MPEYRVSPYEADITLEEYLARKIPFAPPAYLNRLIHAGKVKNSQGPLSSSHHTVAGETVMLPNSKRLLDILSEQKFGLDILYESREILIVNKPSGLSVHRSEGHELSNLTELARRWARNRGRVFSLAPVHRLDLETSGAVLFGKGRKSCSELGKLLMNNGVTKNYIALVSGQAPQQTTLSSLIPAKGKHKEAHLNLCTIATSSEASLIEIELITGRQHQIRRQLAEAGHPLFGDQRYRGPCPSELGRLFLHSSRLQFRDPFCNLDIDITVKLPTRLREFLLRIGIDPSTCR